MRRPPSLAPARQSRSSTTRWQKLYSSQRWRKASKRFLSRPENALCRPCKAQGLIVPSKATDHIRDHHGDEALFWSEANWQPICASCHSSKTRTGKPPVRRGCTASGIPLNRAHHWHTER
jgi:5-methylcytosine-specific restriction endonuclease McrA